MKIFNLIDTYRKYYKTTKGYTFYRADVNGKTTESRVDYILVPQEISNWYDSKIYTTMNKISKDHRPIGITLNMTMKKPKTKKPKFEKIKKMEIKDLKEETITKIKDTAEMLFNTEEWRLIRNMNIENCDLENIYSLYNKTIWELAEETITVKEKSNGFHLDPLKKDENLEKL